MKKLYLLILITLIGKGFNCFAQLNFTEIPTNIAAFSNGNYDWADYDHDGDLDLVIYGMDSVAGAYYTKVYRNDGSFVFTDVNANLPAAGYNVQQGIKWGDFNNDNQLDLLITANVGGSTTQSFSRIYKNNGNNTFTDINAGLPANNSSEGEQSSGIWGDFNNDGYLDFALKGYSSPCTYFNNVYQNNGNGTFTNVTSLFPSDNGNIVVGDFNNDGKLDIATVGFNYCSTQYSINVYQNNGAFSFTAITNSFAAILGDPIWVDYNNDGYLDLFVAGRNVSTSSAHLYKNNGNGTFTEVSVPFSTPDFFDASWGDYDHDGYPDLVMSSGSAIQIYHNNAGNSFTLMTTNITVNGVPKWIDVNNDGNLELFINENNVSKLYVLCTPPSASITSGGNTTFCSGGSVQLNANLGGGLTYQWKLNGGNIGSATNSSYVATQSGNYTVVVSNSGCSATSSSVTVTATTSPSATITPNGNTTFCQGGSVQLTANYGVGYTYQWQLNGSNISATNQSYTATQSGNFTVIITNGNCSDTATAITVIVNTVPSASATASGNATFCQGGSVQLNANVGGGLTYQWQLNGGNIGGATNSSYTASQSGNYTVIVSNGSCSATSSMISVTVHPLPNVTFPNLGSKCINAAPITLTGGSPAGGTYSGTGISSGVFTPLAAGAGTFTLTYTYTDGNGCTNSATSNVTVNGLPVVSFSGFSSSYSHSDPPVVLSGSPAGGIFTGDGMSGNTFYPQYTSIGSSANVVYIYTDGNGCTNATCNSSMITALMELQPFNGNGVRLYPNPNNGEFALEFNMQKQEEADIAIVNAVGQVIGKQHKTLTMGLNILPVSVKNLANGTYFVQVLSEGGNWIGGMVKE